MLYVFEEGDYDSSYVVDVLEGPEGGLKALRAEHGRWLSEVLPKAPEPPTGPTHFNGDGCVLHIATITTGPEGPVVDDPHDGALDKAEKAVRQKKQERYAAAFRDYQSMRKEKAKAAGLSEDESRWFADWLVKEKGFERKAWETV